MQDDSIKEEPELTAKEKKARFAKGMSDVLLTLQVLTESQKTLDAGVPFDREAFCAQTSFAMHELERTIQRIQDQYEQDTLDKAPYQVPLEDKEFELSGYPLPSDAIKLHFDSDLQESKMFEVFEDSKTEDQFTKITRGAFGETINKYGHIIFVEDMFYDNFDEDIAFILMNSFFWIFYHMGNKWLPLRSYAIEMLSLFPEAILKQYPVPEDFIEKFSSFTKGILASRGICTLKTRPTPNEVKKDMYAIKTTDAFAYLLEPSEYVMAATLAE